MFLLSKTNIINEYVIIVEEYQKNRESKKVDGKFGDWEVGEGTVQCYVEWSK